MGVLINKLQTSSSLFRGIVWHGAFFASALALTILEATANNKSSITDIVHVLLLVVQISVVAWQMVAIFKQSKKSQRAAAIAGLNFASVGVFVFLNAIEIFGVSLSAWVVTFLVSTAAILQLVHTRLEQIERRETNAPSQIRVGRRATDRIVWLEWAYDSIVLIGVFLVVADRFVVALSPGQSVRSLPIVLLGVVTLAFVVVSCLLWGEASSSLPLENEGPEQHVALHLTRDRSPLPALALEIGRQ